VLVPKALDFVLLVHERVYLLFAVRARILLSIVKQLAHIEHDKGQDDCWENLHKETPGQGNAVVTYRITADQPPPSALHSHSSLSDLKHSTTRRAIRGLPWLLDLFCFCDNSDLSGLCRQGRRSVAVLVWLLVRLSVVG